MIIDATSFDTSKNVFEVYNFFIDIQKSYNINFDKVAAVTEYFTALREVTKEDVTFEPCPDLQNMIVIDFSGFCLTYSIDIF